MDKDVAKGKLKQAEGKVRDAYGDLAGDTKQQIKGKAQQVQGKIQEGYGHVKSAIKDRPATDPLLDDDDSDDGLR